MQIFKDANLPQPSSVEMDISLKTRHLNSPSSERNFNATRLQNRLTFDVGALVGGGVRVTSREQFIMRGN